MSINIFMSFFFGVIMGRVFIKCLNYLLIVEIDCNHARINYIPTKDFLIYENELQNQTTSVEEEIVSIFEEKVKFLVKNCSSMTDSNQMTQKNLVFVGVMTTANFTLTRAKAVYETWAKNIPGKVVFFSSEKTKPTNAIPLVRLKGVNDDYPPRKKSLYMLKYIFDHYLNKYEFFYRADDDLFIRGEELEKFLSSINSSKALMIGQPGLGTPAEKGHLSLGEGEYFCLGGPGIIFSRELLKKLGNKIYKCFRNFLTIHEDVELWRCVKQQVGVSCVTEILFVGLFQHYKKSYNGMLSEKDLSNTLSLHPLKNPELQVTVLTSLQILKIKEKEAKMVAAMRELHTLTQDINNIADPLQKLRFKTNSFVYQLGLDELPDYHKSINKNPFSYYIRSKTYLAGRPFTNSLFPKTYSSNIAMMNAFSTILRRIQTSFKIFPLSIYLKNNPTHSVSYFLKYSMVIQFRKTERFKNLIARINVPYGPLNIREAVLDFAKTLPTVIIQNKIKPKRKNFWRNRRRLYRNIVSPAKKLSPSEHERNFEEFFLKIEKEINKKKD